MKHFAVKSSNTVCVTVWVLCDYLGTWRILFCNISYSSINNFNKITKYGVHFMDCCQNARSQTKNFQRKFWKCAYFSISRGFRDLVKSNIEHKWIKVIIFSVLIFGLRPNLDICNVLKGSNRCLKFHL